MVCYGCAAELWFLCVSSLGGRLILWMSASYIGCLRFLTFQSRTRDGLALSSATAVRTYSNYCFTSLQNFRNQNWFMHMLWLHMPHAAPYEGSIRRLPLLHGTDSALTIWTPERATVEDATSVPCLLLYAVWTVPVMSMNRGSVGSQCNNVEAPLHCYLCHFHKPSLSLSPSPPPSPSSSLSFPVGTPYYMSPERIN